MENSAVGPTAFDVQVNDLPAIEAQAPVANGLVPRPEPVQPVILPSVIVAVRFPSVALNAAVAPGLRATPLSEIRVAFGPSHQDRHKMTDEVFRFWIEDFSRRMAKSGLTSSEFIRKTTTEPYDADHFRYTFDGIMLLALGERNRRAKAAGEAVL